MAQVIVFGSPVQCADGKAGSISHIVLDSTTHSLEYLVVHRGLFGGHEHCLPVAAVRDASEDRVSLTISAAELKALPELDVVLPDSAVHQRSIPERCAALKKGTPVTAADGTLIGRLRGLAIDSAHQVEQILLDDKDQTRIPAAQLSDCTEAGLTVRLAERAGAG
jgi:hypothetical protein